MLTEIIILIFLLLFSAFFSGSETALFSVNPIDVMQLRIKNDRRAILIEKLLEDPQKLLTTILIGNNLVNIAASAIATSISIKLFGNAGVGIATGVITLFVLVFGEITPKSLAKKYSLRYSRFVSPLLYYMQIALRPIIALFVGLLKMFMGEAKTDGKTLLSEDAIMRIVDVSEKEGIITDTERDLIERIFEFDETIVREVMVPRIDIIAVDIEQSLKEIVNLLKKQQYSRLPVYRNTIDEIVGIIYAKDLLDVDIENKKLEDFMHEPIHVPDSVSIEYTLRKMKIHRVHMVIVLDEFGGTAGLVTMENLLEKLVGDIKDEHDIEPKDIKIIDAKQIIVDAKADIDDINEALDRPVMKKEGFKTVGGYILFNTGKMPKKGDKIRLDGNLFIIKSVSKNRIDAVKIISDKALLEKNSNSE
ncbi:MAG: hemolysin family protein [Candidatus Zixiibacteriota bacterium]